MNIKQAERLMLRVADLRPNEGQIEGVPANPRYISESDYKALCNSLREDDLTGILQMKVYDNAGEWVVLDGNMRLRALNDVGVQEVECIVVPQGTPAKVLRKIVALSNSTFGEWDMDMLANEWDEQELRDWGIDIPGESANDYSRKVESPTYEPTMAVEPTIAECADLDKYHSLLDEIEQSNVSEDEKDFLRLAATRHIVFDYANIAERYARANSEVQRLMEHSALVIVDFGSAIENGFVKMTKNIQKLLKNDGSTE